MVCFEHHEGLGPDPPPFSVGRSALGSYGYHRNASLIRVIAAIRMLVSKLVIYCPQIGSRKPIKQ